MKRSDRIYLAACLGLLAAWALVNAALTILDRQGVMP